MPAGPRVDRVPPAGLPGADPTRPPGGTRGRTPSRLPPRTPPRVDAAPFQDDRVQAHQRVAVSAGLQDDRGRPSAAQGFLRRHSQPARSCTAQTPARPGSHRRFLGLRCLRKRRRRQGNCGIETAPGPHQLDSDTRRRSTAPTAPRLALFYFPAAAPDLPRASVARSHARSRIICVIRNAPPADGRMHRCAFRITCDYTE